MRLLIALLALLCGCSASKVRCDAHLQPINAPAANGAPAASPAAPNAAPAAPAAAPATPNARGPGDGARGTTEGRAP